MNIAIVLPNWVGDVVMATPTLRAVRAHFSGRAKLVGVLRPYSAHVLAGLPWFDEHLHYDPRARDRSLSELTLIRNLRKRKIDTVLLLTNSLRTGFLAWMSGAKRRLGYVRYGRGPLLTERLQPPRQGRQWLPVSAVDYYLKLAYALGCPEEPRRVELATTEEDERGADRVWDTHRLGSAARVVTLNSGGAYGAAKHWPPKYFVDLAKRLIRRPDTSVLVLCGPHEREVALEIERSAADPRVTSLAREPLSLGLSKSCVRRSQLLITTDSGPRHFAAAFDVPAVTLFGPTDPRWSWNYHPRETVVQQELTCVPCSQRVCPLQHHRCMRDLTPEKLFYVVQQRLNQPTASRVA